MIAFNEALDRILSYIQPLGSEKVSLLEALGRIMAEDIFTHRDIPPFDNSGMDGYAVKYADIRNASKSRPILLKVAGELPAGSVSTRRLRKGQAIRIMTGASIPKGVDTVIPVEATEEKGGFVSVLKTVPLGAYIRRAGEDVKKGDCIISKGDFIRPAEVGMLASAGLSSISVYQRPLVAILCNGEELVDVDGDLKGGKIVSSNLHALAAQVKDCGAIPIRLGIARDRKGEIKEKLLQGLRADLIISSAGISAGNYDFVKDVLHDLGMKMVFWKVAMKPGKPLAFGTLRGKPVFGLPGNPVSSMVTFEQFVRPSLLKMMGHQHLFRPVIDAILKEDIRKEAGNRYFIRAFISAKGGHYYATTRGGQGPGQLRSMMRANGFIVIPEDQEIVKAGEKVKVQLLDRDFWRGFKESRVQGFE
jgi:molybdopterin molybdotransferase